jgi:sugar phosphate isomerase/epimerase
MRIAISNIAWNPTDEAGILDVLATNGIEGIEIAPTKIWPNWDDATPAAAALYRRRLADAGFAIPALQAILYGRPEALLFGEPPARQRFFDHICRVADLAAALGAHAMVYGAPGSRDRGTLPAERAFEVARATFERLAAACAARGTALCIEPNPPRYSCNFITTGQEGLALVEAVASPGFRLHLDTAGMMLVADDVGDLIPKALPVLDHFHISEPDLAPIVPAQLDHQALANVLLRCGYSRWVSIEMRAATNAVEAVRQAVEYVARLYPDT